MKIDLSKYPLFENLTILNIEDKYIDIHNDYDFVNFEYCSTKKEIRLSFSMIINPLETFCFYFNGVTISSINIHQFDSVNNFIVDIVYRGKFEIDGSLHEKSKKNEYYFYIDFLDDIKLEFWALEGFASSSSD